MIKLLIPLLILSTQSFASPRIVTVAAEPRIQRTPNYDPNITHAAGLVRQLTNNAVFLCGHINPLPIGDGHVDVSEIKTPGKEDRYLIEVFLDFQC